MYGCTAVWMYGCMELYGCMHVFMYVCVYVCMYVCMYYVCMHAVCMLYACCVHVCMYGSMYGWVDVWMGGCMDACIDATTYKIGCYLGLFEIFMWSDGYMVLCMFKFICLYSGTIMDHPTVGGWFFIDPI